MPKSTTTWNIFAITSTGEPINFVEYATRIAANSGTNVLLLEDWNTNTALYPNDTDYIDPDASWREFTLESRPGLSRLTHAYQAKIPSLYNYFSNEKKLRW